MYRPGGGGREYRGGGGSRARSTSLVLINRDRFTEKGGGAVELYNRIGKGPGWRCLGTYLVR